MVGSKCILVILDGWGIGKGDQTDAIANANTSFMDSLCSGKLVAKLRTDGENVGLPEGQMGNSEVGHLNIGAGRVVYQDLVRINRAIADGSFYENPVLQEAIAQVKSTKGKLHFVGLASEGGVHSHQAHLVALCKAAASQGISPNIHLISDGRDADPKSGKNYWKKLQLDLKGLSVKVCSLVGRYYAMDRDQRWERIKLAYDLYTAGKGEKLESAEEAFDFFYQQDISDEFIKPVKLPDFQPIEPGDTVLFFNFRTDRCRQMVRVLSQESFPEFEMKPLDINLYTFTRYDSNFKNVGVLFEKDDLANTLGEVLAKAGKSQMRMAETEKYPHVSFFFSGGREKIFEGENRMMVNSPKVATYDLKPEMSALELADAACEVIEKDAPDFICLNFANPDMVGHTGVYAAIVKAVETTDRCLEQVYRKAREHNYSLVIIADHGNADQALNDDGTPNTAHSVNPVPIIVQTSKAEALQNGILADVAPTILEIMGVDKPEEMTGKSLLISKQ